MPDYPIDLGRKMGGPCCPCETSKPSEKYYPTLYLDWDEKYEIPESGKMTIEFVRTRETNTKEGGKKTQSVTLEIKKILSVKPDVEIEEKEEDSGEALDKLKKEYEE